MKKILTFFVLFICITGCKADKKEVAQIFYTKLKQTAVFDVVVPGTAKDAKTTGFKNCMRVNDSYECAREKPLNFSGFLIENPILSLSADDAFRFPYKTYYNGDPSIPTFENTPIGKMTYRKISGTIKNQSKLSDALMNSGWLYLDAYYSLDHEAGHVRGYIRKDTNALIIAGDGTIGVVPLTDENAKNLFEIALSNVREEQNRRVEKSNIDNFMK